MHPLTRLAEEFLGWKARFEDSTELPPHGASYEEILAALTPEERTSAQQIATHEGRKWLVEHWSEIRSEFSWGSAPAGASYAGIMRSLKPAERKTVRRRAAREGRALYARYWSFHRTQLLYIRSL